VLVASHIVPWSECATNEERLDPDNGFLLTPYLAKLFDKRLISFRDSGVILVRPDFASADLVALGVRPGLRLRSIPPRSKGYLARHRADVDWVELTQNFSARMLVWKAMESITPMMAAILRDASAMDAMVAITWPTTCPRSVASAEAACASWLACLAFSAFCLTAR
jgi:hypothetical protein